MQGPTKWAVPIPDFKPTEGLQPRSNNQQPMQNGIVNPTPNIKTPIIVSRMHQHSINYQNYEDDQEDGPSSLSFDNEHYLYDRKKVVCSILMALAIIMLIIGTALLIKSNHNEDKWKAKCEKERKVDNSSKLLSKYDCLNVKSYQRLFSTYIFLWEPMLLIASAMVFYATVEWRDNSQRFMLMVFIYFLSVNIRIVLSMCLLHTFFNLYMQYFYTDIYTVYVVSHFVLTIKNYIHPLSNFLPFSAKSPTA